MKNFVVVGLGNIAVRHRANLKELFPSSRVLAIPASGRIVNEKIDNADLIVNSVEEIKSHNIDFAIVASPATMHVEHALPFINMGIPVLIEKPLAASSSEVSFLIEQHRKSGSPVAVGYCFRFNPSALKVKELLDKNSIGEIRNTWINVGQYLPDWRPGKDFRASVSANRALGGGALLELSHELDYAQWLLGDMEVEHAVLRSSEELKLEVEDIVDVVFKMNSGGVCSLHMDFLQRPAMRKGIFLGSKGRIEWDLIENDVKLYLDSSDAEVVYSDPKWDKNEMYLSMTEGFVSKRETRHNQYVSLQSALKTIQIVERIKEKAGWS